MLRKYLLPILAVIGALVALLVVVWSEQKAPVPPIPYQPPTSPYEHSIGGAGIVEASSENISVGSPFNEIVAKIFVKEGDMVKKGDPLFELDLRLFEARAEIAKSQLKAALVTFEKEKKQFSFYTSLTDKRAVSQQAYEQAQFALWQAAEQVRVTKAQLVEAEVNIQRSRILAPVSGEILQVNVHVGEIAPVVAYITSQATLMLMGRVTPLQLRVDIDENDAWRYKAGSRAVAFVRGNGKICIPLKFVRIEPYIIPKASFTGDTTERIDTRVLQVLYSFEKKDLPVFAGQIVDVFIEAPQRPDRP